VKQHRRGRRYRDRVRWNPSRACPDVETSEVDAGSGLGWMRNYRKTSIAMQTGASFVRTKSQVTVGVVWGPDIR
jgi:hypothetical protein